LPAQTGASACYIGGIFSQQVGGSGLAVFVDDNGKLGMNPSSRRFKRDISSMDRASEAILALKPVTFHYKNDRTNTRQSGLIAEDVDKVSPDLVVRDKEGKPYSVRYDQVNAMLLNEFLKEHGKNEEQQKQIEALTAGLQKLSAQVEASKPAPQVAQNNR
jgi:trimeric autotransporter adhesin